jgi:FixJ family two-component response regulator
MRVVGFGGCRPFLADTGAHDCDCLVLDVRLRDGNGLALHKQLAAKGGAPPVVFISGHGDIPMVVQAMRQGALDFLEKPFGAQALLDRIHEAVSDAANRRRERTHRISVETRIGSLTPRERQVMAQVARGTPNKEIGHALGISVRTVEHHRASMMRKMRAASVPGLVGILGKFGG